MSKNKDYCRECGRGGQLLCCDGCTNSFHFSCLSPPLDPQNPPEGDWYCPLCAVRRPIGLLFESLESGQQKEKDFQLPAYHRNYFDGVRTGPMGKYEEYVKPVRGKARGKGTRSGLYEDTMYTRLFDNKTADSGPILCVRCGRLSDGRRPIIQCDFCDCSWHLDCLDPPLANPPTQKIGSDKPYHVWMCPNHAQHDLGRYNEQTGRWEKIRRPRNARLHDIEVLPNDEVMKMLEEQNGEGVIYRLPERGIELDFITRVKE